ncbi:MAG: SsrA-binding protein [Flavobacteriales bacterium]|nr:SsrA-binding protein [Flavobacteriales bacterium]MBG14901.1 SsrA-binding protein [Crocinitomicaceae bacterium]|tara:strand:+ start:540 stop:986 length:447 start_codon:yes stop_codon:yes gene_type:complete
MSAGINIKNKKARFEFEFIETYTAGIVLTGTEIKSIRASKASIGESYGVVSKNEIIIRNMYVQQYDNGTHYNHEPRRDRKLLLNRSEINKIDRKIKAKGLTLVPVSLFINNKGLAKLEIALAKGKKIHDKREDLKKKDAKREVERRLK